MPFKDVIKRREYAKAHYNAHKEKYLMSNNKRRRELKQFINNLKASSPYVDCGENYPYYVMDFDHLSDKEDLIIKFIRNNNRTGLEKEIAKCEIVCSNCHRKRTYERLHAVA